MADVKVDEEVLSEITELLHNINNCAAVLYGRIEMGKRPGDIYELLNLLKKINLLFPFLVKEKNDRPM